MCNSRVIFVFSVFRNSFITPVIDLNSFLSVSFVHDIRIWGVKQGQYHLAIRAIPSPRYSRLPKQQIELFCSVDYMQLL